MIFETRPTSSSESGSLREMDSVVYRGVLRIVQLTRQPFSVGETRESEQSESEHDGTSETTFVDRSDECDCERPVSERVLQEQLTNRQYHAVPDATAGATNEWTALAARQPTAAEGTFAFPELPVGECALVAENGLSRKCTHILIGRVL